MDIRISFIKNYLLENFQSNCELKILAEKINVSTSYLHLLFKKETGKTPHQYIREIRLEKARQLLETSFLRVKEVRTQVGIIDDSHFTRDFKRKFGLNPSEHRKNLLKRKSKKINNPGE